MVTTKRFNQFADYEKWESGELVDEMHRLEGIADDDTNIDGLEGSIAKAARGNVNKIKVVLDKGLSKVKRQK